MRALVIGGGSGIGAAVVAGHLARGDEVRVWDVAGETDVRCDIAQPAEVDEALAGLDGQELPDLVTITAGIGHAGMLAESSPEEWDRVMAINARGPWLCMRGLANAWHDAGRQGSIIATSSVSAHLVDPSMGIYCASKAALSMLVKVAAAEWAPWGIRVNAVAPGITLTPMVQARPDSPWLTGVAERTALQRLGTAADIAEAVLALHGTGWVTGQVLDCDGGLSLHSPLEAYREYARWQQGRRPRA